MLNLYGLDSALSILGYHSGRPNLGLYDNKLADKLLEQVSPRNSSETILQFLNEYYLYPNISMDKYKSIFTNYLNSCFTSNTSRQMDNYLFQESLGIMVNIGDSEMQKLILRSYDYWDRIAQNYQGELARASEDNRNWIANQLKDARYNAYCSQYALRKLGSASYSEQRLQYFNDMTDSNNKNPDFVIEKLKGTSSLIFPGIEPELLKSKRSLQNLSELIHFQQEEINALFNLQSDPENDPAPCNSRTTIFVNGKIGYIIQTDDCDEEYCLKCHQYGHINFLKLTKPGIIQSRMVASWN